MCAFLIYYFVQISLFFKTFSFHFISKTKSILSLIMLILSYHLTVVYWIHDRRAHLKGTIQPNEKQTITTMLAHEWWVRDARTDTMKNMPGRHKMTENTCLYNPKIVSDTKREYVIRKRTCYDLSGHCSFWNRSGRECNKNPTFMHETCALTCQQCEKDDIDDEGEDDEDEQRGSPGNDEL